MKIAVQFMLLAVEGPCAAIRIGYLPKSSQAQVCLLSYRVQSQAHSGIPRGLVII